MTEQGQKNLSLWFHHFLITELACPTNFKTGALRKWVTNQNIQGKWREFRREMERTLKKFDGITINTENGRSWEYGPYVVLKPKITQTNQWDSMAARQTVYQKYPCRDIVINVLARKVSLGSYRIC